MITLAEPVEFGNPENDPVYVVAALTAADHGAHIEALSQLADVLANDEVVGLWAKAKDADEILKIVEENS